MSLNSPSPSSQFYFNYAMTLTSPVVSLNEPVCLSVHFMAESQFSINLGYLIGGTYHEKLLHRNILATSMNSLARDVPAIMADDQLFVFLFKSKTNYSGPALAINDIQLSMTNCAG